MHSRGTKSRRASKESSRQRRQILVAEAGLNNIAQTDRPEDQPHRSTSSELSPSAVGIGWAPRESRKNVAY